MFEIICDVMSATPKGAGDGVRGGCEAEATVALLSWHSQCPRSLLVGKHEARQGTRQEASSNACGCAHFQLQLGTALCLLPLCLLPS